VNLHWLANLALHHGFIGPVVAAFIVVVSVLLVVGVLFTLLVRLPRFFGRTFMQAFREARAASPRQSRAERPSQ
jgi:hypothetical protein